MSAADEILKEARAAGCRESIFERWLSENKEGAKLFWAVMESGYLKEGIPFSRVLKSWQKHFPDAPAQGHQAIKRLVDAKNRP